MGFWRRFVGVVTPGGPGRHRTQSSERPQGDPVAVKLRPVPSWARENSTQPTHQNTEPAICADHVKPETPPAWAEVDNSELTLSGIDIDEVTRAVMKVRHLSELTVVGRIPKQRNRE